MTEILMPFLSCQKAQWLRASIALNAEENLLNQEHSRLGYNQIDTSDVLNILKLAIF